MILQTSAPLGIATSIFGQAMDSRPSCRGSDWNSIHDLLRVDTDIVEGLEDHSTQYSLCHGCQQDACLQCASKKSWSSNISSIRLPFKLQAWAKRIIADGGWANVGDVFDLKTNKVLAWTCGFATKWQRSVLQKHGKKLSAWTSTHKTCTGRKERRRCFFYTQILARSKDHWPRSSTAFLLTNVANRFPIIDLLKHLRHQEGFPANLHDH